MTLNSNLPSTTQTSVELKGTEENQTNYFCDKSQTQLGRQNEDNSVPNRILPRKRPGLYMIHCLVNDWRYYGESSNVSGRLASHRSMLNRQIHPNRVLQADWDRLGPECFTFVVLFMGPNWELPYVRRGKEQELIILDRSLCYNILETNSPSKELNGFWSKTHSPETKKKISEALKGRPNDLLGRPVSINGVLYPSIAEASRQTGMARKTIRQKFSIFKKKPDQNLLTKGIPSDTESGTVERPSQRE